jgi:hypothetical protein
MNSLSEVERFGFLTDDIKSFLAKYDILIDGESEPEAEAEPDAPPITEKTLGTTERNTLLTIIAALCHEAKLDRIKHAKTAGLIQSTAAGMGLSIGETTIENHLKKIPNAIAGRMK